jgi:hypothetical protein
MTRLAVERRRLRPRRLAPVVALATLLVVTAAAATAATAAIASAIATAVAGASPAASPAAGHAPRVLRVGTYHGIAGRYRTIQAAIDAARPGDWVLVGPGDYKTPPTGAHVAKGATGAPAPAGVLITTPDLHLRGMTRNKVIVDGTKRGSPACSSKASDQTVTSTGVNGIEVYKASGSWVQNLTVCNFLTNKSGGSAGGNEIWWNGGQGTGRIGMGSYWGDYLTATSTYSNGVNAPYALYGIYTDNADGPGSIVDTYASNTGDSAYYIGACPDCNAVVTHAFATDSALGMSMTNSGGHLVVENSVFEHNKSGITANSQDNSDAPSPQRGACPGTTPGPLDNGICDIWENNLLYDNNNASVPGNAVDGLAGASPVGAAIVLAGTRQVAVYHNRIVGNGAWGVLEVDLPDPESPPTAYDGENCQGGTYLVPPGAPGATPICYFQALGNQVTDNYFAGNGSFGNPTNGDVALFTTPSVSIATTPHTVYDADCFSGNSDPHGFTSDPPDAQSDPLLQCDQPSPGNPDPLLAEQAECAAQLLVACPSASVAGLNYPHAGPVKLEMAPAQPTMPNPCAGAPANPWCPAESGGAGARPAAAGYGSSSSPGAGGWTRTVPSPVPAPGPAPGPLPAPTPTLPVTSPTISRGAGL